MSTIFEKIIAGEIPSYTIYEDQYIYAFLDIHPMHPGHILVIPRTPSVDIFTLDDTLYSHLMLTIKNIIAPALMRWSQCQRVGVMIEGFGVPDHAHIHLIPLMKVGDLNPQTNHTLIAGEMTKIAHEIQKEILKH